MYDLILSERLQIYLASLDNGNGKLLDELERRALEDGEPIIRKDTQSFLKVLLAIHRPKRILEVGTAVGFSALLMAANTEGDCQIETIEKVERRILTARENIAAAGMEQRVTVLPGDAGQILKSLPGPYDFIFMDAAKGQYPVFLPEALRLLRPGGLLLTDNVLQDGALLESRYAVERRDRTIHRRMREYLYTLTHSDALLTSVLAVGDGVAVSVKKLRTEDEKA